METCFAALLLMFGLGVIAQAMIYGITGPNIAEPGFFPFLAGLLLSVSAGVVLFKLRRDRSEAQAIDFSGGLPVIGSIGVMAVYIALIGTFGMVVLAPFFIFAIAWFIERPTTRRQVLNMVLVALGFTGFAYFLFSYLLRVPLPRGIFNF
ncbi:MAG: hypothetical protein ABS76_11790 [Pelagibacterium sp. SCN 64-44]|nr:MAG: hypothetical protein ABS76_11790 [Pelagibacterium sp. SCN 64-44]